MLLADGTQESLAPPGLRGARERAPLERVDRYVIKRRLGAGGMGVVYVAHDPDLGRDLAIKMLRRGTSAERLRREAQALARLSHPNVVTVHDVGEHEGQVFVAMELVDGLNLREWLATPRATRDVLRVLCQAARGIIAAHAAELIHRDLKPDNIFVARGGDALVGDFGLARDAGDAPLVGHGAATPELELTATGTMLGTPAYMAPEQARGQANERSDQFSFCVTAFEALFGARPFQGTTVEMVLEAARRGEITEPPRTPGIPGTVVRALRRGLHADPDARFGSMTELLGELEPPRRRWPFVVAGVGGLGATIAVTTLLMRSAPAPDPDEQCAPMATLIDAVWNPAKHAALASALHARATPELVVEVGRRLDRYADSWTTVRRGACAAEVSQRIAPALAAARVGCLETRKTLFDATVTSLAEPTAGDGFNAWKRIGRLPSPMMCESDDVAVLSPSTEEHGRLMRDLALATTGEALEALGKRVEASPDLAARLEINLAIASDALDDTRLVAADAALERARPLAEQLGVATARVRAFALSARSLCIGGRDAEATRFLELAVAGTQRLHAVDAEGVADEVFRARDECMYRRGEYAALLPLLLDRLAAIRRRFGPESPDEATLRWRLGQVYIQLDRRAESAEQSAIAARIERRFVPPKTAAAVDENALAVAAYQSQDLEAALVHTRRSVELWTTLDEPDLFTALLDLGGLYEISADPKAAIAAYSLAFEKFPSSADTEELATRRSEALDGRGLMRLRIADPRGAVADFQEAIAIGARIARPDLVASAQVGLGRAWVALGEHPRAVRVLTDALRDYQGSRLGPGQFALAQALWETGDRSRATQLARTAETEVAKSLGLVKQSTFARKLVPTIEESLAKIERWRDTHR